MGDQVSAQVGNQVLVEQVYRFQAPVVDEVQVDQLGRSRASGEKAGFDWVEHVDWETGED